MASELNQIERSTVIRAPRSKVWRSLTDIGEFCSWFCCKTSAPAFQPGAQVPMISTYSDEHYGVTFTINVAEMIPERTFSWHWHPGAPVPGQEVSQEPMTQVTFQLEDVEGGTRVTITETGFDQLLESRRKRAFSDNNEGWKIQLAALDKYVSGAV